MTDSQDDGSSTNYQLPEHLIVSKADIVINYIVFFFCLGAFIGGLLMMHAGFIIGFGLVLFIYVLRVVKNFFFIFAPRLPSYKSIVREAYAVKARQDSGLVDNRTITQDDAINYALGGIAMTMPYDDQIGGDDLPF